MSIVALVAVPLLVGGGVVAVLIATGTWASSTSDSAGLAPPAPPVQPSGEPTSSETATPQATSTSEVPKLLPVHPPPLVVPHPTSSVRPAVVPAQDGGAFPPPLLFPSAFPSSLPPFPSVLPFPTNFPPFPSVLPVWPPPLQTSSSHAPNPPPGPGY